jgi:hypothetical protein
MQSTLNKCNAATAAAAGIDEGCIGRLKWRREMPNDASAAATATAATAAAASATAASATAASTAAAGAGGGVVVGGCSVGNEAGVSGGGHVIVGEVFEKRIKLSKPWRLAALRGCERSYECYCGVTEVL